MPLLRQLILASVVWSAASGDYYIDSGTGSDDNAGTSPAEPWRSLAQIASVLPLAPGGHVRLVRGGVWRERLTIAGGGNATHGPVTFTSYGSTAEPKPLLLGSVAVGASGNWSAVPGSPGQWRTHPQSLVPAPDAVQLLHNADFGSGGAFWSLWNEHPEGSAHVNGSVDGTATPPRCLWRQQIVPDLVPGHGRRAAVLHAVLRDQR
eukprot:COSAG04_NODE_2409_length_4189_cov_1.590465_1_plen_206_part_00